MRSRTTFLPKIAILTWVLAATGLVPHAAEMPAVLDVPRMRDITIDGDAGDWGTGGFRVEMMNHKFLNGIIPGNFDPRYRLGWDERGLLLVLTVRDDVPLEHEQPAQIWQWDNVQLTVAPVGHATPALSFYIAPGADPARSGLRMHFEREDTTTRPIEARSMVNKGGYVMEVRIPWAALQTSLEAGDQLDITVAVCDIDDRNLNMFFAGLQGRESLRVRLAAKPSPQVKASVIGSYERMRETRIWVFGTDDLAGLKVRLLDGGNRLAAGVLRAESGRATTSFTLAMPPVGKSWGKLTAVIPGQPPVAVSLADAGSVRGQQFAGEEIVFKPGFVFVGSSFPAADFEHPFLVESLIGPYSINTTFHDREYNPVTTASQPGRYGAVVEITPRAGRVSRRFHTITRLPDCDLGDTMLSATIQFPVQTGMALHLDPESGSEANRILKWFLMDTLTRRPVAGALLAAVYENRTDPSFTLSGDDPWNTDRQWWVTFKRKLYGTDKLFPAPFASPRPVKGKPAPVLIEGTLEEAGIRPDALKKVDTLLEQWAADSDQAFAVCMVRHGVIALHKAYGTREGTSMTVTTQSWMASITKLMSANLMLQLVDQGLVDMDAPITQYLPVMRGISVEKPITVRNLYTHTGGLWGHWGDNMHDMEERVADYYHYLGADRLSAYNGAGNSLGSKIIETITGEALPGFFKKHLLDPLAMEHTWVVDSSGGTRSVPMDMAKFGQMLLNRGAYGDKRFFSEATFEKMLPAPMVRQFGPATTLVKGFGMQWFVDAPLSKHTMWHGAASSATFCVDLDHDLVLVMCRNSAGKNYGKYFPLFIEAVRKSIIEDK